MRGLETSIHELMSERFFDVCSKAASDGVAALGKFIGGQGRDDWVESMKLVLAIMQSSLTDVGGDWVDAVKLLHKWLSCDELVVQLLARDGKQLESSEIDCLLALQPCEVLEKIMPGNLGVVGMKLCYHQFIQPLANSKCTASVRAPLGVVNRTLQACLEDTKCLGELSLEAALSMTPRADPAPRKAFREGILAPAEATDLDANLAALGFTTLEGKG